MKNKSVTSNKGFANWIEDFITGLAKKEASVQQSEVQEGEKEDVLAEINLNDLDKVIWKEETFGVHFDEKGASLINEFGNVVRTLQDTKNIEEVDKILNSDEIVVANVNETDDEDSNEIDLKEELDKIANSLEEELDNESEVSNNDITVTEDKETIANTEDIEDIEKNNVIAAIESGFEELEATINSLQKRLALVEQQHARNPQIENVSDNSQDEEIKNFTESSDETAKEIEKEHNVDLTSPAGRVELSQKDKDAQENVTQQEDNTSENQEEQEVDLEKNKEKTEGSLEGKSEENIENQNEDGVAVEKLAGVSEKIFQKGICPETGEELIKSREVNNFLGVYSSAGTEYAVDLNSGDIYKYLK